MSETGPARPATVSILDVAEDVTTIETCVQMDARFAGGAGAAHHEPARNPFTAWASSPVELRAYRLRDVVLDRSLMVLLKDGCVIAETNYLRPETDIAGLRIDPGRLVRPDPGRAMAICFDHWEANYYHWIAHTLPTVHAVRQRHPANDVGLVLPPLRPWQRTSLDLMGAAALPCLTTQPGMQYFLPAVEYYDLAVGSADFAVSPLSQAAYTRMSAGVPAAPPPHRPVYIDRRNTPNRRVPNEPALIARLMQRGFDIVRPEELALEQQIALFKGASMVVGMLGAGLANIAFCQPGTVVYELVPDNHLNPCFLAMAMQGGLDYWADTFPTDAIGSDHLAPLRADIDIEQVMRRIDELEPLIPRGRRAQPARSAVQLGRRAVARLANTGKRTVSSWFGGG